MFYCLTFCLFWLLCPIFSFLPQNIRIDYLKVNTHLSDLIINSALPRFTWQLATNDNNSTFRGVKQTSYQLQISSLVSLFNSSMNFTYDSGQVNNSDQSIHVQYNGTPLQPNTFYTWRLRYWTNFNTTSEWASGIFRTGLLNLTSSILLNESSQWIGHTEMNMNEIRKEFTLDSQGIQAAVVYICGVGYYELFINGQQIDASRKLDPAWTTYPKRIYATTFNVTQFLQSGQNALGVRLGNGWYSTEQYSSASIESSYGPPRFLFQLYILLNNSSFVIVNSDTSWRGRTGSILLDSIFNGEIYDARNERSNWTLPNFTDNITTWSIPMVLPSPINVTGGGILDLQLMDPIRMGSSALHTEILQPSNDSFTDINATNNLIGISLMLRQQQGILMPITMKTPMMNVFVYDLGQSFAGWCQVNVTGKRGSTLHLHYAEVLKQPGSNNQTYGTVDIDSLRGASATDIYVLKGDPAGETYTPRFTVHGFRYVSVQSTSNILNISNIQCFPVHSETSIIGNFQSSNRILNQLQQNIQWSQLSNLMSIPTDCPQRDERKGSLGDVTVSVNEALYNFDLPLFYLNYLTLIVDNQRSNDGALPDIVPFVSGSYANYPADPNWGSAFVTTAWTLYQHYGDLTILSQFYEAMRSYIENLRIQYQQVESLAKYPSRYGDWLPFFPPYTSMIDIHLVSSYAFLHDIHLFKTISSILNQTADLELYSSLYKTLTQEFHLNFYNITNGYYGLQNKTQTNQILALSLPDLVPKDIHSSTIQILVDLINSNKKHCTSGLIGMTHVWQVLSDNGYHTLAVELASSITYRSLGWSFNNAIENATTIWENLDAPVNPYGPYANSRNHIMYGGGLGSWYYSHICGIDLNALKIIYIRPRLVEELRKSKLLSTINCELNTLYGRLMIAYTRNISNEILYRLIIPPNINALVKFEPVFPSAIIQKIEENQLIMWDNEVNKNSINGVTLVSINSTNQLLTMNVQSGTYLFRVTYSSNSSRRSSAMIIMPVFVYIFFFLLFIVWCRLEVD